MPVNVEKLIEISLRKPLDPETFVPWKATLQEGQYYLPPHLISLYGTDLFEKLTAEQRLKLGKSELGQAIFSYSWSEGIMCLFMTRYIMKLAPDSLEKRFLLRELIEECRHQQMFNKSLTQLNITPVPPAPIHRFLGMITAKYMSPGAMFLGTLAVEYVTDMYGSAIHRDHNCHLMARKMSQLHNIEEGRHIAFTEDLLERFTQKATFFTRVVYSILALGNVCFMRSLYVQKRFFEEIGVDDPGLYYRVAKRNYRSIFGRYCLKSLVDYMEHIRGFNWITRPIWERVLHVKLPRYAR